MKLKMMILSQVKFAATASISMGGKRGRMTDFTRTRYVTNKSQTTIELEI
jgi:hypothetical protein